MAEQQSSARLRAHTGASTSGVIHIRTRLTADFTVLANALVQRPGSAVTIGVAAYILSLPDGAPVSITALCVHFTEGEILISRALRELEEIGYLERRRERGPGGLICTRTYFHDVPARLDGPARHTPTHRPPVPPRPRTPLQKRVLGPLSRPDAIAGTAPDPAAATVTEAASPETRTEAVAPATSGPPHPLTPLAESDPQAALVLASLRLRDPRLILSQREAAQLAPAITQWLAHGIGHDDLVTLLTTGLPNPIRARPAHLLAYRLRDLPLAVPDTGVDTVPPAVLPWQTCDGGCERAFRAAEPGRCRDCPPDEDGEIRRASLRAAC
ncbi:hypothetical protein [Streptomyces sp. NBC_01766]|uniref:hypothetical protein n=1 Tax=Streptomyces sp. NBC_01766 TaxID=2975936 RepID=UPI002DD85370|nr:hypothetical protein [Streptomyces sp. NBC_01766]WSC21358.1 hypothetical protein OIE60_17655 [Streptomyces sp. NBC_01766]